MKRITGIIVIFEDGEYATPFVDEVVLVDRESGKPVSFEG